MRIKSKHNNIFDDIQKLLDRLIESGIPEGAVDVYKGRNRVVKYAMPTGEVVNIKAFRIPHIINRFAYGCIRASKAERAYTNAMTLTDIGFNTPTPLGFIEERNGILFGRSFFVSQQVDGYQDIRKLHEYEDKDRLLEEIAKLMVRLHQNKVWMKDFSAGNILWRLNDKDEYEFMLVDINRMQFNVKDKNKWMSNFGNVVSDEQDLLDLAHYYARHADKPRQQIEAYALKARENHLRRRRMIDRTHKKTK